MFDDITTTPTPVYTPEQVAKILQLNKNTVYGLINKGEIIAKKIGKVFRIPAASISFALTGLDYDLYQADRRDKKLQTIIRSALKKVR
jgi:excisionase family DNA binding protein